MKPLYIKFMVNVMDAEYSFNSNAEGESQAIIQCPAELTESLDADNIFDGILAVALSDYKINLAESESTEDE